jgi:hypothetical protein
MNMATIVSDVEFGALLARIRGEYREMPGLRLTRAQASRLWNVDAATCAQLLETLVGQHVLEEAEGSGYVLCGALRAQHATGARGL